MPDSPVRRKRRSGTLSVDFMNWVNESSGRSFPNSLISKASRGKKGGDDNGASDPDKERVVKSRDPVDAAKAKDQDKAEEAEVDGDNDVLAGEKKDEKEKEKEKKEGETAETPKEATKADPAAGVEANGKKDRFKRSGMPFTEEMKYRLRLTKF